jgi:hypothetical protein
MLCAFDRGTPRGYDFGLAARNMSFAVLFPLLSEENLRMGWASRKSACAPLLWCLEVGVTELTTVRRLATFPNDFAGGEEVRAAEGAREEE